MLDRDRADVADAILDRLVGRQIDSRPWTAPPDEYVPPPVEQEADAETQVVLVDLPEQVAMQEMSPVLDLAPAPSADPVAKTPAPVPEVSYASRVNRERPPPQPSPGVLGEGARVPLANLPRSGSPVDPQPRDDTHRSLGGDSQTAVAPAVPHADAHDSGYRPDAEALALRSLLTECGAILRWLCTKAEHGELRREDVSRARAFLSMAGLPPPGPPSNIPGPD